jgi:hypothetical protein
MGKLEQLASRYERYIKVPWQRTLAGAQRVILVVYDKELERSFRARKQEWAQRTRSAGCHWVEFDCTKSFANWMASDEYREAYFEQPEDLQMKLDAEFIQYLSDHLRSDLQSADDKTVVGVTGVGSLYGFARVSELVRSVEPEIQGRLAVFFPGTKDGNNYRLLDARDGWNYLANSITLYDNEGAG